MLSMYCLYHLYGVYCVVNVKYLRYLVIFGCLSKTLYKMPFQLLSQFTVYCHALKSLVILRHGYIMKHIVFLQHQNLLV